MGTSISKLNQPENPAFAKIRQNGHTTSPEPSSIMSQ